MHALPLWRMRTHGGDAVVAERRDDVKYLTLAWPLAVLILTPMATSSAAAEGGLPAEECVRILRGARIARMHEDAAAELAKLHAAFEACPDEISPVYGLMAYYQLRPELVSEYQKFRTLLLQRLEDPDDDLRIGVVEYLIRDPDVEGDELRAILGNVSRQVSKAAVPDPALMRIQAQLQQRLGKDEAAVGTLERLWRQTAAEDVLMPLIHLYFKLERWQDAADLMAPQVAKARRIRYLYVRVLGKLGRYDEAMKQVELFASGADGVVPQGSVGAPPGRREDAEAITLKFEGGYVIDVFKHHGLFGLLQRVAWDLRDQGQDHEAEKIFRGLLAQAPDDPETQATVLNLYASDEERQNHARALADTWQSETDANALFDEGTQRLTAGDAAGAIDLLKRAAPELPDLEPAWYNLGMAAYRLEDWATVASAFARAAELNPARAQTFFFRGIALEKLDRCGEAVKDLARAAELDPGRALAHYYLAVCHRKLGNQAAAAAALERYEATRD